MNIKLDIPEAFYGEEVRNDYTVVPEMKKMWAIQLDLLTALQEVCEKHGLVYYADSGTLIGAIRHKGFIPWDDDIDIVMKRKDYDKLIDVAANEFQYPYFLQSAHSELFPRGYARLRNSDSTAITKNDLGRNINQGVFIDIFPLDNLPDDPRERKAWLKKIHFLFRCMNLALYRKPEGGSGLQKRAKYRVCRAALNIVGFQRIVDSFERLCRKYDDKETKTISYVAHSFGKKKHLWESACFDSFHTVPFEFTQICIPDGYDARLRVEYGDYMKIVRAASTHGNLVFDPDTPYSEYLQAHKREEIEKLLND